jgi:hypothetical protein
MIASRLPVWIVSIKGGKFTPRARQETFCQSVPSDVRLFGNSLLYSIRDVRWKREMNVNGSVGSKKILFKACDKYRLGCGSLRIDLRSAGRASTPAVLAVRDRV